jgi:hypothetical protein
MVALEEVEGDSEVGMDYISDVDSECPEIVTMVR